jgi:acyl-CoA synthetase (NDP forming)/RimJ/RimL family protein N-acetyltransferase
MDDAERWEADVVLTDGGVAHLRPIRPDDADAVVAFHQRQSPESLYYRYFSPKPSLTAAEVAHLTSVEPGRTMAFVAFDGDLLVGIGRYDHLRGSNEAELAFQADEAHRGRGLATIFLEYLIAAARESGLDGLVAEVLPDNRRMLAVFERAGFDACRRFADGVIEVELSLDPTDASRAAIEDREQRADARSVGRLLAPSAVAVIAGEGPPGDPARAAFDQLVAHEFAGPVVRVGEASAWTAPAHERIEDIPDAIDLAVVAVAPGALHATLAACAAKSVRGIVLLTPSAEAPADLVAVARRSGMRLIGPGALGVVNTAPDIRLHALPLAAHVDAGPIGFLSQSGSLAAALLQRAAVLGLGFSSVVSVGDKADLSANDLLQHWEHDDATRVVALYLQSFGNPRKFSRIARRVSRRKPVVAVKSGRAPVDTRSEEWPDDMLDALMRQTGVIRVDTTEELLDVARVLATQPVPVGRRVAVVTNRGGPALVTADACAGGGLVVDSTVVLARDADATAWAGAVGDALAGSANAAIVVWADPAGASAGAALKAVGTEAANAGKPVVATVIGREPGAGAVPTFSFPERAARSLGRVASYGAWLGRPAGVVPAWEDVDVDRARGLVDSVLADDPSGRRLSIDELEELLTAFGVRAPSGRVVADEREAADALDALGSPVVLKALGLSRLGKVEAQGVALDLNEPHEVRAAYQRMARHLGDAMRPALVQQMVPPGADVLVRLHQHPRWGSTVSIGVGGAVAGALDDRVQRVVPLTDLDAGRLIDASPVHRLIEACGPAADRAPLEDLVLRVSALADALPEVATLALNPVIVGPEVAWATAASAEVRPWSPGPDPGLRRL